MGSTELEELRLLRERAYGPTADIHDDTAAMERLRELEDIARPAAPPPPTDVPVDRAAPAPDLRAQTGEGEEADRAPEGVDEASAPSARARRRRPFPGRLTAYAKTRRGARVLLWAGTLLVTLAVALAAVTVVQRVSGAPLRPEAEQVARLASDDRFETPAFFGSRGPDGPAFRGYREFAGLRAIVALDGGYFFGPSADECMYVMQSDDLAAATGDGFPGQLWLGCAAGDFPATAQFVITADNTEEVRTEFPIGTALQFVYDSATDEVVVFRLAPETMTAAS
jgi:hypothetical protein